MAEAATNIASAEKPKRKPQVRTNKPRAAYLLVNLPDGVSPTDIEIVGVTRKAEEALEAIDTEKAGNYIRCMIK